MRFLYKNAEGKKEFELEAVLAETPEFLAEELEFLPETFVQPLKLFNAFCANLDGVQFVSGDPRHGEPFQIEPHGEGYLITISPGFSYQNLLDLMPKFQALHNHEVGDSVDVFGISNQMCICEEIRAKYHFWAGEVEAFVIERSDLSEAEKQYLIDVAESLRNMVATYPKREKEHFSTWDQEVLATEAKKRWNDFFDRTTPEKRRTHLALIGGAVGGAIHTSLEEDLENLVLERGVENLWRNSEIADALENNVDTKDFFEFVDTEDPVPVARLSDFVERFRGKVGDETLLSKVPAQVFKGVAKQINLVIYGDGFWEYESKSCQINEAERRQSVNCVARSLLEYVIWKKLFQITPVGVLVQGHIFASLDCGERGFLSLDGRGMRTYKWEKSPNEQDFEGHWKSNWVLLGEIRRQARDCLRGWYTTDDLDGEAWLRQKGINGVRSGNSGLMKQQAKYYSRGIKNLGRALSLAARAEVLDPIYRNTRFNIKLELAEQLVQSDEEEDLVRARTMVEELCEEMEEMKLDVGDYRKCADVFGYLGDVQRASEVWERCLERQDMQDDEAELKEAAYLV